MVKLFVLVSLATLEVHQHADQSVSQVLIVLKMKHAAIRNAKTHVQELVELVQNVKWLITIQFAVVLHDTQEIHSFVVHLLLNSHYNHLHLILANHLHVDPMLNVELLVTKHLAHVYQK